MLTWLNTQWSGAVWLLLRILAAIWILVSICGYFTGVQVGFVVIPFFIAGIWAMQVLAPHFKAIASMPKAVMLFSLVYVVATLTAYTVGRHTLLGAYEDWAVFDRTVFGAIRIFAPYIVLTLGAIYFALTSTQMKWPKFLIKMSMLIMVLSLMLHGIVEAYDKWTAVYLEKTAQAIEVDRLDMMNGIGLMARPKNDGVKVYQQDPATLFFEATDTTLSSAVRYPYLEREGEQKDGMYILVCVSLPDSNGEFTRKSPVGWVRNGDVTVEPRSSDKFHIKKSPELWEVEFYTDETVRVMDVWTKGTNLFFTSNDTQKPKQVFANGQAHDLWLGQKIVAIDSAPLDLKHCNGGKVTITFP